ncbi:HAUS6_N domain-containing protein [Nephila pilipes]|uniref:HAUS6_N domain-containing protein n=1 Tax=Nephila pilipes TaxID=299642 RepID=A0A8X6ID39_NEPPI|nr:HAUS6_N domain-containing protein [Nephila pilipes]
MLLIYIKDYCPELEEIGSLEAEDDQVYLLKYLKVYSIFLKFYVNILLKGDLTAIQELLSIQRTWNFENSLEKLKSLNERLAADTIPIIKESNKNLQDKVFLEEFSEGLQAFASECSSWNFSSKNFQEKIINTRSALSSNVTDEDLKSSLLTYSILQDDALRADGVTQCPDILELYSDTPKVLSEGNSSNTVEFSESNVSLSSVLHESDNLIHSLKLSKLNNQNALTKEEFEIESPSSDVFIPFLPNGSEEAASIPPLSEATKLIFDTNIDYRKPFKMRESWLLEESLNSVTLPETSFLD